MPVLIAFALALAGAWLHWAYVGWAVVPGLLSVYVAAYLATLVTAIVMALRSGGRGQIVMAMVLAGYFLAGHILWGWAASLEARAVMHLALGGLCGALFRARAAMVIGAIFLLMFATDLCTFAGIVPSAAQRMRGFIVFSHPDVLAILGHVANVVLGLWSDRGLAAVLDRPAFAIGGRHAGDVLGHSDRFRSADRRASLAQKPDKEG